MKKLKFFNRKHFEDADGSFTIRFPMGIFAEYPGFHQNYSKKCKSTFFEMKKLQLFEHEIV